MRPTVYIETTIVSYLVARPSRDPIMAERQRQTREWWNTRRGDFHLRTSELVLQEAAGGEREMARTRLGVLHGIPLVPTSPKAETLVEALVRTGLLPEKARSDAWHIALAATAELDYLLTWNCRHIANPAMSPRLVRICLEYLPRVPMLTTPEALLLR
jgi:hypothetical protein